MEPQYQLGWPRPRLGEAGVHRVEVGEPRMEGLTTFRQRRHQLVLAAYARAARAEPIEVTLVFAQQRDAELEQMMTTSIADYYRQKAKSTKKIKTNKSCSQHYA